MECGVHGVAQVVGLFPPQGTVEATQHDPHQQVLLTGSDPQPLPRPFCQVLAGGACHHPDLLDLVGGVTQRGAHAVTHVLVAHL